ncbi:MAG: site-2 protease family protein [Alphaproteobacteria bacterium]|nr:site-2 protease family protein [Alphaproteobacteria bacterium]NCQ67421.1 site-2 protease family protein [Alphaproteobacteria bacterium]NCT08040.1 site-2 protease family protein [Alphaproteobacteria bacterium]
MDVQIFEILANILIYGVPAILAITLHEAAHGYAALQKGDDTAKRAGRLSLNPLRHVDPFGTVILPAVLIFTQAPFIFGYAKPVPVNFNALRRPRLDMVYVAVAGPATNILLAVVSALLFYTLVYMPVPLAKLMEQMLAFSININVLLAVFNMLPIPPLDGGRVAVGFLPPAPARLLSSLERWGFVIIIGSFMLLPFILSQAGVHFSLFDVLLRGPMTWTINLIASLTGITNL